MLKVPPGIHTIPGSGGTVGRGCAGRAGPIWTSIGDLRSAGNMRAAPTPSSDLDARPSNTGAPHTRLRRRALASRVDYDLIVAVEPLEEGTRALGVAVRSGQLAHRTVAVDRLDHALLPRVDRQDDVGVRVGPVDQDGRGSGRQPLTHGDG